MTVAEYVARFLVSKGVRHVFGYQGGAILKLLDEIVATREIEYVQNYHEQASAFAADSYSRVTGNIGVAIATSGPGATNLVTGIANSQLDSVPTFFITGQDYSSNVLANNQARQNGFQDLNISNLVESITKYSVLISDPKKVRYELEKAYWFAINGRPGAVLVDIPIDIQFAEIDECELVHYPLPEPVVYEIDYESIIELIKTAQRPVVLIGGGVRASKSEKELRDFIKKTKIPVVSTLNGLDVIEGGYGYAGLHGNTFSNLAIQNCDLLFAFGVRFGQRQVGKFPEKYTKAKIIHVDIDDNELGRIFPDEVAVMSDLLHFLSGINEKINVDDMPDFEYWHEVIREWKRKYKKCCYLNLDGLDPVKVVEETLKVVGRDSIFTSDVGQNQMWVAQAFEVVEGQRLLNSCALGAMGYSLPASIGAIKAYPNRRVICFTGDGGLQMNLQELILVGHKRMPLKCVVFNNNTLGMMREVQARYYDGHYYGSNEEEYKCVDLEALASAMGLGYRRVVELGQIRLLAEEFNDDNPYIFEMCIQYESLLSNRYDEAHIFADENISGLDKKDILKSEKLDG